MTIQVHDGLIWSDGNFVSVLLADKIANANDFLYAERIVQAHAGKELVLDPVTLRIISP